MRVVREGDNVNPNTADVDGQTPLSWAAKNGNKGSLNMLLEQRNADPDLANGVGQTPLSWAVISEDEEVVRMLVERSDADPDLANRFGQTPRSRGAEYGNEGIMRICANATIPSRIISQRSPTPSDDQRPHSLCSSSFLQLALCIAHPPPLADMDAPPLSQPDILAVRISPSKGSDKSHQSLHPLHLAMGGKDRGLCSISFPRCSLGF